MLAIALACTQCTPLWCEGRCWTTERKEYLNLKKIARGKGASRNTFKLSICKQQRLQPDSDTSKGSQEKSFWVSTYF